MRLRMLTYHFCPLSNPVNPKMTFSGEWFVNLCKDTAFSATMQIFFGKNAFFKHKCKLLHNTCLTGLFMVYKERYGKICLFLKINVVPLQQIPDFWVIIKNNNEKT